MTEKDVVSKTLESYPDVFADIITNERSVSKYWRNICFNIIVCRETENQSDSDKYLPVRIFSSDSTEYGN